MNDLRLGFISPEFRQDRHGDFFIREYRRIDPDIRDVRIKSPAGTKDLRESLSRVFRLQQWSIPFPGSTREKRFFVGVEPYDYT